MTESKTSPNSHSAHSSTKANNLYVFYAIACVIPFVFFLLLEVGLRLISYGEDVPLFIDNPASEHYILPRPDVMNRYFPAHAPKPTVTLETNFLLKQKPANGLRIFVQGGSTAAGFPYGYGASLGATLDQRLKQSLPTKHVEVVNTALSAVNSYTLLDFADEIIEQEPDAVLIYAGHNEYLGILGVGSNFALANSHRTTKWFLALKNLRVFQLVQNLFFSGQSFAQDAHTDSGEGAAPVTSGRTFMSQVAKQKEIIHNGEVFDAGLHQFSSNMQSLLEKYTDADIPVFIGTVASNKRDQAPFSSLSKEDEYQKLLSTLRALDHPSISANTLEQWQKASELVQNSKSADLHYEFAQELESLQLFALAKVHYSLAVDHDLLRFRAPSSMNEIIKRLAASSPKVYLVDTLAAFEQRSQNLTIGNSLMLEHLHPNLQGYFVLSESFYQALEQSQLFSPWQHVPIEQAWQQRLVLPAEEYFGFATIQKLKSDYPFSNTAIPVVLPQPADWQQTLGKQWFEKRIDWLSMMEKSLENYRGENNQQMAFKTLQILADAMPHNGLYNLQLAEQMLAQNRLPESLHYYQRAKLAGAVGDDIDNNISAIKKNINER